ncbi:SAP [Glarea lozoyensis ATCC 20868]|uniref:SAP n=1 Tax=Glarea lozoyensis (strain ATCC 20868 / MF5171) TaxID=1116229 RepID=S3DL23_GLAL2|nr:SAP [Glarea lozoyensis ATCC 20868]EPE32746.1 SAP [Glarea lozoyensis ATCC 20868]
MTTDYNSQKVPELKKLLSDRGLPISGNKADLIARLQENDKKGPSGATGEDEIDWDEDDAKATTEPAAAAVAAGGQGQVANPAAVPNQKVDVDPSKTDDLKVVAEGEPKTTEAPVTAETTTEAAPPTEAEAPKQDFTAGISQSSADVEAEKRAARAKRFGLTVDDEAQKLAERAKKFGIEKADETVKGLDSALPEGRQKRNREERPGGQGGRNAKRQTPDRRTAPTAKPAAAAKKTGKLIDDPVEKAKAEARAKRFQAAT